MSQTTDTFATEIITLPRHILEEQRKHRDATGDLSQLLVSIQVGCKFVSNAVRKAKLVNLYVFSSILLETNSSSFY